MNPAPCSFAGESSIYGIGIRLGFYFQWIGQLLTTIYVPKEVQFFRSVSIILQIALFSSLLLLTTTKSLHGVEPIIIFWLVFGALSGLTPTRIAPFRSVSGICRLLLYSAIAGYACWYWFVGLDRMISTQCQPIAFFGSISIDGWFRTLNKIASVGAAVLCYALMTWPIPRYLASKKSDQPMSLRRMKTNDEWIESNDRESAWHVEISLAIVSVVLIAVSIGAIEYLIVANGITGINAIVSVGQLIPFLVGALSLPHVLWDSAKSALGKSRRRWTIFGREVLSREQE